MLSLALAWQICGQKANATQEMEAFVCDTDKNISCFSVSNSGNDIEDMQKDLQVCDCLENKFGLQIKDSLTPNEIKERDRKIFEGKLFASLLQLANNIEKKAEPYLLESLLINPNDPAVAIKQVFDTKRTGELVDGVREDLERYRSKVSPEFYQRVLTQVDSYTKTGTSNIIKNIKNSKDKLQEKNYCLSYEGFLTSKMIPESPVFWQALGSSAKFNPSDWEPSRIYTEMKMGKNVELNKAKLTFLEMNPTIKAVFTTGHPDLQEKFFKVLKEIMIPEIGCIKKNDCQGRYLSSGQNLPSILKEFYEKNQVRADVSGHLFVELSGERRVLNGADDLPPGLTAIRLASDNKKIRYRECGGGIDPRKVGDCADFLKNYCTDLRTSGDSILQIKNDELVSGNQFKIDDSIFSPADKNMEYASKNEYACNQMKRIDNRTKKEINFKEYKSIECRSSDCSNVTDVELFKRFMNNSKSVDKGLIFDKQSNEEQLIAGIANAGQINITEKVLNIASEDHSVLRDQNKSNGNMSINDVIASIEKSKPTTSPQSDSSTNNSNEANFVTPELLSEKESNDGNLLAQDLSLQNLGTFGNQAYLNAPAQFLAKIEEDSEKKEGDANPLITSSNSTETTHKEVVQNSNQSLEERIKGLEKLLEEKDSSTKDYQKMITQLLEQKNPNASTQIGKSINSPSTSEVAEERKTAQTKSTAQNIPKVNREQYASHTNENANSPQESFTNRGQERAPASLSSPSTTQSFASNNKRVNNTLLTKYGIVVKDNPSGSNNSVSIAEEAESSKFQGVKSIVEAADVPLQVSVRDFEQIKTNNLGALEALYSKELKGINDQVVKVLISTNSSEEVLEFYAIKEDGRVVFQPIRKNKLSDLQNVLHR